MSDDTSTDDDWSFSNAGKKMWQAISGISVGNIFKRKFKDRKDTVPEYWETGSESKIKDYMGWDL